MVHRFAALVALVAMMLVQRPARADDAPADASTPKGAANAFFNALKTGNVDAAKALVTGSEKQVAVVELMVPLVNGFKLLDNALIKKWGDEGHKALSLGLGVPHTFDLSDDLKNTTETITGDTAVLAQATPKDGQRKEPVKLKKVDGQWKLDMSSIPAEILDDPKAAKVLKSMADIAKATAKEVEQGQYATPKAAKDAMDQKILPLYIEAAGKK
jgi:hypothetical protein